MVGISGSGSGVVCRAVGSPRKLKSTGISTADLPRFVVSATAVVGAGGVDSSDSSSGCGVALGGSGVTFAAGALGAGAWAFAAVGVLVGVS
jgi:hypothetical protein